LYSHASKSATSLMPTHTLPQPNRSHTVVRPQEARSANSALILQLLRGGEPLSRADIARATGLSEGTISRIVADLMSRGFVVEDGAENSTGGRPATRLQLSSERLAMGVDIGTWETRFAVGTMRGKVVDSTRVRTPSGPEETLDLIVKRFRLQKSGRGVQALHGVGVSIGGIVNSHTGVVEMGHNQRWARVPIREHLQDALGVPVYVENNVRAAAVAEYQHTGPALKSSRCLLYVLVGEGVGVGIVLDGKLYSGPTMAAGEFGQMVIAFDNGPERHDRPGSFEQLICNAAICDRYAALTNTRAGGAARDSAARVRRICQQALKGEHAAMEALRVTGTYMGVGIANLVWGLDPDTIVISSSLDPIWPILLPWITAQFPHSDTWPTFRNLRIQQSALGEQGPLLGATILPFSGVFQTGELTQVAAAG
jgi:predicted NBD/HSP70 family sugar kinase